MSKDNKVIIPSTPSMTGNYPTGGGTGKVTAWTRPDLVIAAPAGIGAFTPASSVFGAGNTITFVAGQDLNHAVQGNHASAIQNGQVFYTYGKASNANKPNTETGIKFHAASGNVNTQSQSGATKLTADKAVEWPASAAWSGSPHRTTSCSPQPERRSTSNPAASR